MARIPVLRIGLQPRLLNLAAGSRVDHESAEWVDQGHVQCRETTDRLDVDRQIDDVALPEACEGQRQEAMYRRIPNLAEGLITNHVEHSKRAVASTWRDLGLQTIGFSQSMDIRCAGWIMALIVPSEPAAKPPPQRKQRSNRGDCRRTPVAMQ